MTTLLIRDEAGPLGSTREWKLNLKEDSITVRDLIRERIRAEVEAYNKTLPEMFQGLIQPNDAERALNGYRMRTRRLIDADQQLEKAIEAFDANQILVLVDDYQVGTLDERVELEDVEKVTFLRLVPLAGG